ncbi:MAG TPA: hypothetical protein VKV69_11345 [Actinomycetota bacterium]|nr:hypothetical protein [Actinomycetota bacterium]
MSLQDPEGPQKPPSGPRPTGRSPVLILLALALIAALVANVALGVKLRNQRGATATLQQQIEQLNEQLDLLRGRISGSGTGDPLGRIAAATAMLRGLDFLRTVKPELLSPAELAARVSQMFAHDNSRAALAGTAAVLATYGLLPAKYDLYDELRTLNSEQVLGFYDDQTKRMVVGAEDARNPDPFVQVVLAHEYTHALADQHFGLGLLDKLGKEHADDAQAAFLALAEGDATFTMDLYRETVLTSDQQKQFIDEAQSLPTTQFDAAPQYLQDVLQFPYDQGLAFVTALHERGGFDLVDQAYRDPPTSTEQIMHPTKYLDTRDNPTPVTLPNVLRALGSGWSFIQDGGVGEFDVLELLERGGGQGLSSSVAAPAAAGWDGGEYGGYRSSDGVLVATETAWDADSQAREAADAFDRWLSIRYPGGSAFDAGSGQGWQSSAGAGEVVQNGARLLLLLGPSPSDLNKARAAFAGF